VTNSKDLKDEQDYKAKIKPDCDFIVNNWTSRFNQRKTEMDGLTTAKEFLAGVSLATAKTVVTKAAVVTKPALVAKVAVVTKTALRHHF